MRHDESPQRKRTHTKIDGGKNRLSSLIRRINAFTNNKSNFSIDCTISQQSSYRSEHTFISNTNIAVRVACRT